MRATSLGRPDGARIALAAIRLLNGTAALLAPAWMARRFGIDPDANPAALFTLRLFGIRTIVIGTELLLPDDAARARALRYGVAIHLCDAMAAILAGALNQLPRRAARTAAMISATNAALAIIAQAGKRRDIAR
jgi:dTDP-4-amino-4,6-dideoxygalactose transaminase